MCCRYYLDTETEISEYIEKSRSSTYIDQMSNKLGRKIKTEGEIFPTDIVPVIANSKSNKMSCFPMKWGFTLPRLSSPLVNARVETAAQKKTFEQSWFRHRCIIPASWYYEWEHFKTETGKTKTGSKYAIHPKNSPITYLAGLYRMEKIDDVGFPVFSILTRSADEGIVHIHDRMPVILPKEKIEEWISPRMEPNKILKYCLTEMQYSECSS